MVRTKLIFSAFLAAALCLSACAPEDLDITPTLTATATREPTNTPLPTRTPSPTEPPTATPEGGASAATEAVAASATEAVVEVVQPTGPITTESMIALLPAQITAGAYRWQRGAAQDVPNVSDGSAQRVPYSEAGGAQSEITFGVFDTPEAARAYYDAVLGRVRTLQDAETREDLPQPNAFGGGTYGADAILVRDVLYIRVSVPQFSSTAGNPLVPLTRAVNAIADTVLGE